MGKIKLVILSLFLLVGFSAQAMALPSLPADSPAVFEFNSWEFISNREIDSSQANALEVGDTFAGVLNLDGLTDGSTDIWSPLGGEEITAYFTGLTIASITPIGGNKIDATYSFTPGSTIDIYFDDTPDLLDTLGAGGYADPTAGRNAAITAATNGTKLLQLTWGEYRTTADTAGTPTTDDDTTDSDGHMNVTADTSWAWNDMFQQGIYEYTSGSGNFYDFQYSNVIYAPFSETFNDFAGFTADNDDLIWDFYNTDDFKGKTVVPEPSTFFLFGIGLLGVASFTRRKRKKMSE